jgi:hypothetical protein
MLVLFSYDGIERKIVLASDVYFRPPITIRFHNLHVGDIREVVVETTFYHERDLS